MILDGKTLAQEILADLKTKIGALALKHPPRLAAILVGSDPTSVAFLKQKEKAAHEVGVEFRLYEFSADISNEKLRKAIGDIGRQQLVAGMVLQLPLPERLNTQAMLNAIPKTKDVDVLTEGNIGAFAVGRLAVDPPPVGGIKRLITRYGVSFQDKYVLVVGQGRLIGRPVAWWLLKERATFTAAGNGTENIAAFTALADVIITGVGKPGLITGAMVKQGAAVFDFGSAQAHDAIVGDVDFKSVEPKASYITPVPGGMGPLTVAMLFENLHAFITRRNAASAHERRDRLAADIGLT
jgi:methylenetetrahydrofolate dehydrogenase (NADP+)/methenyltetrahydrofolate cyclohydrolase